MKISGLDALARKMKELEKAIAELDGDICQVSFNPDDPESIERAIHTMYSAIDDKVSSYSHNDMVAGIADELKEKYREAILERASAARLEQDEGDDN